MRRGLKEIFSGKKTKKDKFEYDKCKQVVDFAQMVNVELKEFMDVPLIDDESKNVESPGAGRGVNQTKKQAGKGLNKKGGSQKGEKKKEPKGKGKGSGPGQAQGKGKGRGKSNGKGKGQSPGKGKGGGKDASTGRGRGGGKPKAKGKGKN